MWRKCIATLVVSVGPHSEGRQTQSFSIQTADFHVLRTLLFAFAICSVISGARDPEMGKVTSPLCGCVLKGVSLMFE